MKKLLIIALCLYVASVGARAQSTPPTQAELRAYEDEQIAKAQSIAGDTYARPFGLRDLVYLYEAVDPNLRNRFLERRGLIYDMVGSKKHEKKWVLEPHYDSTYAAAGGAGFLSFLNTNIGKVVQYTTADPAARDAFYESVEDLGLKLFVTTSNEAGGGGATYYGSRYVYSINQFFPNSSWFINVSSRPKGWPESGKDLTGK